MEPWAAGEPWKLWRRHRPLEPFAFGSADHIHPLSGGKEIHTGIFCAFSRQFGCFYAEFLEEFGRLDAQFLEVAGLRLGHAAFLLRIKSNLDSIVAILVFRFNLSEGVALDVNDGHGNHSAGFLVKQTGHTDLFSDKS